MGVSGFLHISMEDDEMVGLGDMEKCNHIIIMENLTSHKYGNYIESIWYQTKTTFFKPHILITLYVLIVILFRF